MGYFCKVNGINMEMVETNRCEIVDGPHSVPLEKDKYHGNNLQLFKESSSSSFPNFWMIELNKYKSREDVQ